MALSPSSSKGGAGTVTGVTAADTSIVVAGTAAAPTLATGTLDVIATNHPPAADVAFNAKKITGLGTPTLSTDAVTKAYTDAAINGLDWKQAARLASAVALPANTYVNGASGVGATLTGNAFGALSIDGVAVAVNDRVLLKNEGTGSRNGIYAVTATGGGAAFYVLTRTADYNTTAEIVAGTGLYVTEGTANADTSWVMTTTGAVTVGTTVLTFTQFGGGSSASVVVRGPFSFAFNTPSLAAGIAFYTPTVGDYLLDAWFEIDTAFDGTTPQGDFGSSDGLGVFSDTTNVVNLALASRVDFVISGLTTIRVGADALSALLAQAPNADAGGILGKFTSATPLQVWASQDGSKGGTAVGGTAGAAKLYIVTATPTAF